LLDKNVYFKFTFSGGRGFWEVLVFGLGMLLLGRRRTQPQKLDETADLLSSLHKKQDAVARN